MISDAALDALKDRNPVHGYAGRRVHLRSKGRHRYVGPCPVCSDNAQSKTAQRFECDADKWVCAVCGDGGDIIKLVRKCEGVGFHEAIERLGGTREERPTPATARRRGGAASRISPPALRSMIP